MGQNFYPDTIDQTLIFPPSLHEWLPEAHLARFLVDVVSSLDLSFIYKSYQEKDGRGQAAYAPEMMVRVLLYGKRVVLAGCTSGGAGFRMFVCLKRSLSWMG
jgi:hypothetical protein